MAKKESTIFETKQREANIALKKFWAANSGTLNQHHITEWCAKNMVKFATARTWTLPEGDINCRYGKIMEVQDLLAYLKSKMPTETVGVLNEPVIPETFNLNA